MPFYEDYKGKLLDFENDPMATSQPDSSARVGKHGRGAESLDNQGMTPQTQDKGTEQTTIVQGNMPRQWATSKAKGNKPMVGETRNRRKDWLELCKRLWIRIE